MRELRTEPALGSGRAFSVRLSATPRGARLARVLAVERLDAWGIPHGDVRSRDAALLVAELATNAVIHGSPGGRDFQLRLLADGVLAVLRVEVTDTRPDVLPDEHLPGRGLLLVEGLADRWGVTTAEADHKTVWCELLLV